MQDEGYICKVGSRVRLGNGPTHQPRDAPNSEPKSMFKIFAFLFHFENAHPSMPTPTSTAHDTATPPMTHLAKHLSQAAHAHIKLRTTINHAPPTMDLGPYPFRSYLRLTVSLRTDLYTLHSVRPPSLFSFHTTLSHPLHSTNTCRPQYIQTPHPWSSFDAHSY